MCRTSAGWRERARKRERETHLRSDLVHGDVPLVRAYGRLVAHDGHFTDLDAALARPQVLDDALGLVRELDADVLLAPVGAALAREGARGEERSPDRAVEAVEGGGARARRVVARAERLARCGEGKVRAEVQVVVGEDEVNAARVSDRVSASSPSRSGERETERKRTHSSPGSLRSGNGPSSRSIALFLPLAGLGVLCFETVGCWGVSGERSWSSTFDLGVLRFEADGCWGVSGERCLSPTFLALRFLADEAPGGT